MEKTSAQKRFPKVRSISRSFSYALIGVVTLILFGFATIAIVVNITRIENDLENRIDHALKLAETSLQVPLWNLDNDAVEGFIEALFLDKSIAYIKVFGEDQVFSKKTRSQFQDKDFPYFETSSQFITKISDIPYKGNTVGTIQLALSRESIQRELLLSVLGIIALTILIIGAISLTSLSITRRSISKPISRLLAATEEMARGDFQQRISDVPANELGQLAQGFNRMAEDLSDLIEELENRNEISKAIISTRDLEEILARVVKGVAQSGGYDRVRLYLHDDVQNSLVCRTTFGVDEGKDCDLEIPLSGKMDTVSEWTFTQKVPYVVEDVANDKMGFQEEAVKLLGTKSLAVVPLLAEERSIGIMAVDYDRERNPFPKEQLDSLVAFANTAALAIENSQLYSDLEGRVRERTQQLEEANQRLQELDKVKSDFLSTVSHELRTPLTSVLGFAKIISRRFKNTLLPVLDSADAKVQKDAKKVEENLGIIIDEGERLTRLINDVLDLAKIESGSLEWKMEEVSLFELVKKCTMAFSSVSREKNIEVSLKKKGEDLGVYGEKDRLTQVVTNLISNSIKFTQEGGSVTCTLEGGEESVVVKVIDTGIGIPSKDLNKVFDRFKQVGDTLTDKPKGTGLGLPICKEIIEHHGGEIWAESEPGKGSTFVFTLPTLGMKAKPASEKPVTPQVKHPESDKLPMATKEAPKVLIADDENNIRALLRQELEEEGYNIIEARDGNEALRRAREEKPDLIILDILMPGIDGFDVTSILKNNEETRTIPIMILSIVEDQEKGYRLGVDSYLTKPIDPEQIVGTVFSLIPHLKKI